MACSNNTLREVIDLMQVRDDSPPVIDLTANSPPPSPLLTRSATPLEELKLEPDVLVPATPLGSLDIPLLDHPSPNTSSTDFDEDVILDHDLPPPQRFASRKETIDFLNEWAIARGFALVISTSVPDHRKAYLACVCHPQKAKRLGINLEPPLLEIPGAAHYQRNPKPRAARRTIKKGCDYQIYIKDRSLQEPGAWGHGYQEGVAQSWDFKLVPGHTTHNHAALPTIAVAFIRRMSNDEKGWVVKEIKKGTSAMDIVRGYRAMWPARPIQARDVWNLAYAVRKEERAGFSSSEAALQKMRDLGELHEAWTNDHGQLVGLAYTSSKARALTHRHPTALFFDCTYKTNLYKLPLLHIVGSTATGSGG